MSDSLCIIVHDPQGSLQLGVVGDRFDVHAFRSPYDVLAAINHLDPAAVVLILGDEGIETSEKIGARRPGLPVLLLDIDGLTTTELVLRSMRAGVRDVVLTDQEDWQDTLSRRLEAGFAWRQALDRGQEVQMAALRAIVERSQADQVGLEVELETLNEQLEAERAMLEQTQSKLEIQQGIASQAVRAKSAFLANISEAFTGPLESIVGYTELVAQQLRGDHQDLDRITQTARHLTGMVQSVLNLARLEAGDVHPVFETVNVDELITRLVAKASHHIAENRIDLVVEPSPVDTVVTDPLRLQEALQHLLDNAVRYCPGGRVWIEVEPADDETWFSIRDNGVGLDPDALDEVMEAFGQGDEGERHQGAGLGLAIANQTARVLGGRLEASSTPGDGATFSIVVPNAAVGTHASNLERELTVMIVDDDPVLRKVLERMLVADGHAALTTGRPEEALELAREHQPALIALDVMLPGIDGWTLLQQLTTDPDVRHIPVVIISATEQSERALEEGARGFLDKPIDREALRALIKAHAPQRHRVLVLGNDVPDYLDLDERRYALRPCRADELLDALPSREGTVLFPFDADPVEAMKALRTLRGRTDIRRVAVGTFDPRDRAFLAGRFDGVAHHGEINTVLRGLEEPS